MNSTDYPKRYKAENSSIYSVVSKQLRASDLSLLDNMLAVAYCDGKLDSLHETRAVNKAESERSAFTRRQAE